jgi:hypothetical protein
MKLKFINIIEIILGAIFFGTYILKDVQNLDLRWLSILTGFLLSILYFPLGFLTLKSTSNIQLIYRIFYGMVFSFSILSIMLYLMKIEFAILLLIILTASFLFLAIFRVVLVSLFDNDKVLDFDNGIVFRYLILFGIMIYSFVTYNFATPFAGLIPFC